MAAKVVVQKVLNSKGQPLALTQSGLGELYKVISIEGRPFIITPWNKRKRHIRKGKYILTGTVRALTQNGVKIVVK